jgi:hypothetical protein
MKICPFGAEFHADGLIDRQTDMTNLIVAFCSFANAPKNEWAFAATSVTSGRVGGQL